MQLKCFFIFLCFSQISFGQNSPELNQKIPLKIEKFEGVDNYGNVYYFNKTVFYKIGKDGNFQFNDLQLGKPSSSDFTNPLKIILFYESANTVVFLNNHLIEISRINFNRLQEFKTIGFASEASGDKIWIFNINDQQLEVFDYAQKKVVASSQPINSKVLFHASNFNYCWILTGKFLEKYNVYGSLVEKIPNPGFEEFAQHNGNLIAKKATDLFLKRKGSVEFQKMLLPKLDIKDFYLSDKNLYIYEDNFLYEFSIN